MTRFRPSTDSAAPCWDVLGLGAIAVDDLLYVDHYPAADSKIRVGHRERQGGGLTGTALVAAARLGATCAYRGQLGRCELSRFVEEIFDREGIDVDPRLATEEGRPAHSTIVVDTSQGTRTILSSISEEGLGPPDSGPREEEVAAARVLLIDHHGVEGTLQAIRFARELGVPIVADFERWAAPPFEDVFRLVDHLVVGARFAKEVTGHDSPEAAALALWNAHRKAVVVTAGASGAWYTDQKTADRPRHVPAFQIEAKDTTGCGDVFHGAYAAALAWGMPCEEGVRMASAAAAIKATKRGGQAGIPTREEVERLLKTLETR